MYEVFVFAGQVSTGEQPTAVYVFLFCKTCNMQHRVFFQKLLELQYDKTILAERFSKNKSVKTWQSLFWDL